MKIDEAALREAIDAARPEFCFCCGYCLCYKEGRKPIDKAIDKIIKAVLEVLNKTEDSVPVGSAYEKLQEE